MRKAAKLSGLTSYMVDYLGREGIVPPSGSIRTGRGIERRYTFSDLVLLRMMSGLLKKGVSAKRLKQAIRTLRTKFPKITENSIPGRFLVTDGKWVLFKDETSLLENLNTGGQFEFSFVVDVEPIHREIKRKIKEYTGSDDPVTASRSPR